MSVTTLQKTLEATLAEIGCDELARYQIIYTLNLSQDAQYHLLRWLIDAMHKGKGLNANVAMFKATYFANKYREKDPEIDFNVRSYAIGQPVTHIEPCLGMDGGRIIFRDESFEMFIGLANPTQEEIDSFVDEIEVGMYQGGLALFLYLKTKSMTFDFSLNFQKVNPANREYWLTHKNPIFQITVVDADNMNLLALRRVEMGKEMTDALYDIMEKHTREKNGFVDLHIDRVLKMLPLDRMMGYAQYKYKYPKCRFDIDSESGIPQKL